MAKANPSWTPTVVQDKTAEKLQGGLYGGGLLAGGISWACFANQAAKEGMFFALVAIAAFGLGSLIKTIWVKRAQVNHYVLDKAQEALRMKLYGTGAIAIVIGVLALANGAYEAGGFFAIAGSAGLLIGGLLPVKWIKVGETGGYKKK